MSTITFLRHSIVTPLRDFIYPPVCFTCDQILKADEKTICLRCWSSFPSVERGHPAWDNLHLNLKAEGAIQDFISCYLFEKEGKLQEAIHLLKYQGMRSLGFQLGKEIGRRIQTHESFSSADCLVPVPLHKLKQRERGYNQSELLCRGIAETTNIPVQPSAVLRNKYTTSQTQLNFEERKENVSNAFEVNAKLNHVLQGKTVILVDDVVTTGSTLNALAKELVRCGASRVLAASVALAA